MSDSYHSGTTREAVLAALSDGDKTAGEVVRFTGLTKARPYVHELVRTGDVRVVAAHRDGARIKYVYGLPQTPRKKFSIAGSGQLSNFDLYRIICQYDGRTPRMLTECAYHTAGPERLCQLLQAIGRRALLSIVGTLVGQHTT